MDSVPTPVERQHVGVLTILSAVVLVLFAVFFKWLLVLGLVACAVVGLAILWFDRR